MVPLSTNAVQAGTTLCNARTDREIRWPEFDDGTERPNMLIRKPSDSEVWTPWETMTNVLVGRQWLRFARG